MQRLGQIQSGFRQGKKKKRERELKELFPSKKGKKREHTPWTHKFVCLATHNQTSIPTTAIEKDVLISAGLGEKKIVFDNVECVAEEFRKILLDTFPKLKMVEDISFVNADPIVGRLKSCPQQLFLLQGHFSAVEETLVHTLGLYREILICHDVTTMT